MLLLSSARARGAMIGVVMADEKPQNVYDDPTFLLVRARKP